MGLDCGTPGAPRPPGAGFHEPSVRINSLRHHVDRTGRIGVFAVVGISAPRQPGCAFRATSARPLSPTKEPDAFPVSERVKKVKCPTVRLGRLGSSSSGAAPCSVVAVARPGSPSTAYSPDHKDVGDGEEDDLPEGAPEVVNTGGLSATT